MFWMRAYPLLGEGGGSWALEFSSFFWPQMEITYRLFPISQGAYTFLGLSGIRFACCHFRAQKSLDFQGSPLPMPLVMM